MGALSRGYLRIDKRIIVELRKHFGDISSIKFELLKFEVGIPVLIESHYSYPRVSTLSLLMWLELLKRAYSHRMTSLISATYESYSN
jgi:hypothetical protein